MEWPKCQQLWNHACPGQKRSPCAIALDMFFRSMFQGGFSPTRTNQNQTDPTAASSEGWRSHLSQWKPLLRIDDEQNQASFSWVWGGSRVCILNTSFCVFGAFSGSHCGRHSFLSLRKKSPHCGLWSSRTEFFGVDREFGNDLFTSIWCQHFGCQISIILKFFFFFSEEVPCVFVFPVVPIGPFVGHLEGSNLGPLPPASTEH